MKIVFSILILAMTATAAHSRDASGPMPISDQERAKIVASVSDRLLDPQSAQFGGIAAGEKGGFKLVCGWVNAKNAYGGYTGEKPFIGAFPTPDLFDIIVMDAPPNTAATVCGQAGISGF